MKISSRQMPVFVLHVNLVDELARVLGGLGTVDIEENVDLGLS